MVNATFWIGATLGSLAALLLIGGHLIRPDRSWRYAFALGGTLGLGVLLLRLAVPESPRWLMLRGKEAAAARVVGDIERQVQATQGPLPAPPGDTLKIQPRTTRPGATSSATCSARIVRARCWD